MTLLVALVFVLTAGVFALGELGLSAANRDTHIPAFRRPAHLPAHSRWLNASGGALCVLLGAVASLSGLSFPAAMSLIFAAVAPTPVIMIIHNRRVARGA